MVQIYILLSLQKAYRRGMSVRKSKKNREYTSMKSIGIKCIDETFKVNIINNHFIIVLKKEKNKTVKKIHL